MKTIKERASHYASMYMHPKLYEQAKGEYIKIATEQRGIDIRFIRQWLEREYAYNGSMAIIDNELIDALCKAMGE